MNQDKIDHYNYLSRKADIEAIKRMQSYNDTEFNKLEKSNKDKNNKIKTSELADDSLRKIKRDLLIRYSQHNIELFTIKIEMKRIDRILKLRKKPIIND